MIVIYALAILFAIFFLATTLALACDFKAYKKIYDTLPLRKFYSGIHQVYCHRYYEDGDSFVWNIDSNDFRLDDEHYLLDSILTYFSPYSLYWLIKYRKWFAENVDINKLEDY